MDNICMVWSKPVNVNGVPNTGEQALQDIYKGCAKSAYELLGDSILETTEDGSQLGKCVVIAYSRLYEIYDDLQATYGQSYADGIMETVFDKCWRQ